MPRIRVISDNDYAGDPDGLFQLAHLLLSPSVDVRAVIGSHLRQGDWFDPSDQTATNARDRALEIVELVGRQGSVTPIEGSNAPLADRDTPIRSPGAEAIVTEAMRESDQPLFVTMGGGLTELASAWLIEPRIADRLVAIWIGGPEHTGGPPAPPRAGGPDLSEYNTQIDVLAAQVVFDSPIPLWKVPRDVYRQALMSFRELRGRLSGSALGAYLLAALDAVVDRARDDGRHLGETYVLGDSPLVLLTALQSPFEPDPSSSHYRMVAAPSFDGLGRYRPNPGGRPIRVYHQIDTRLMFEDMVAAFIEGPGAGSSAGRP